MSTVQMAYHRRVVNDLVEDYDMILENGMIYFSDPDTRKLYKPVDKNVTVDHDGVGVNGMEYCLFECGYYKEGKVNLFEEYSEDEYDSDEE